MAAHPKGLYLLFCTEMWERFSYYGMRAILILYLTDAYVQGGLGMDPQHATLLYGIFTGAVYFTPLIGGWLADNYIGQRRSILIGGLVLMAGNLLLAAKQSPAFMYAGLALIVIGNGFFKPNISVIVGKLYPEGDSRIDSAFTIFYMGINVGAIMAPLITGGFAEEGSHRIGFLISGIGLFFGQCLYHALENRLLGDTCMKPSSHALQKGDNQSSAKLTREEKDRTWVIMVLTMFSIVFFAGYEQAGSSFMLFADTHIDREIGGTIIPTGWFAAINPIFVVILAPILSMLWVFLDKHGKRNPSIPVKMGSGLILLGLGFLVMMLAIGSIGGEDSGRKASMAFIVFTTFLHTVGELCLSPIGLSMTSRLSPPKLASLLMGFWFFASAFANLLSGYLASLGQRIGNYPIFELLAIASIVSGILLYALNGVLKTKAHGKL